MNYFSPIIRYAIREKHVSIVLSKILIPKLFITNLIEITWYLNQQYKYTFQWPVLIFILLNFMSG